MIEICMRLLWEMGLPSGIERLSNHQHNEIYLDCKASWLCLSSQYRSCTHNLTLLEIVIPETMTVDYCQALQLQKLAHPELILWTGPRKQISREFYLRWERRARFLGKEGMGLSCA